MDARMATEWLYGDPLRARKTRPWFNATIRNAIAISATQLLNLQAYGNLEALK
jgi:hypothetical protein